MLDANPSSFAAIGVSIAYLLIAMFTGFIMLGIVPAIFSAKAASNREKLAPLAILAAVVAVGFALTSPVNPFNR